MLLAAHDQFAVRDDRATAPRWRIAPGKTKSPPLPVGFERRLGETDDAIFTVEIEAFVRVDQRPFPNAAVPPATVPSAKRIAVRMASEKP